MDRREFLTAAGTAATAGLAGCTSLMTGGTDGDVRMLATAFDPFDYETTVGSEVVWTNPSTRAHTVTAYEGAIPEDADYFASGGYDGESAAREAWRDGMGGAITSGETWRYTFEVPGTYQYFCIPHEKTGGMKGRIAVRE